MDKNCEAALVKRKEPITNWCNLRRYGEHWKHEVKITFEDPSIEDAKNYTDVNEPIKITIILFLITNVFTLTCQLVLIYYRAGRSKLLKCLGVSSRMSPLYYVGFLSVLLFYKYQFTFNVCSCYFENDFFKLREAWALNGIYKKDIDEQTYNYSCHPSLNTNLNIVMYSELFITGISFISVIGNYYIDILKM